MSPHKVIPGEEPTYSASAVAEAHEKYLARNPISAKIHGNAASHMPGGNTRTVLYAQPFPLAITSAAGNAVTSVDGHTYIDFLGEYSAGLFGHSNSLIADAFLPGAVLLNR